MKIAFIGMYRFVAAGVARFTCGVMPLLAITLLAGCGTTVSSQFFAKDSRLQDYKRLHLMLQTTGESVSVTGAGLASAAAISSRSITSGLGSAVSVSHAMSGNDQTVLAAQDVAFRLRDLGFDTVEDIESADAIVLFSIGTVRFDPFAGWIADRAFLEFKDAKTGKLICSVRADTQFITPTVNSLVKGLVKNLGRHY